MLTAEPPPPPRRGALAAPSVGPLQTPSSCLLAVPDPGRPGRYRGSTTQEHVSPIPQHRTRTFRSNPLHGITNWEQDDSGNDDSPGLDTAMAREGSSAPRKAN